MDKQPYMRRAGMWVAALALCALGLCACDSVIYDGEGDCSVRYLVKFRYDYNMKYADAFAHEVERVTLYLLDGGGNVVWQGSESGDALARDGYAMEVDVAPGQYSLLAWCGTDNLGSFTVPSASTAAGLTCTLGRSHASDGTAYVGTDIDRLFHGYVEAQDFPDEAGTYTYTVPLVKNTNSVRVVLQHLSGEPVDKDRFTFAIKDSNGSMDWDNSLLDDEEITYYAWHTEAGTAGVGEDGYTGYSAAIAELTVPRLVTTHRPVMTITDSATGETVFRYPLNDLALLVKGYYNSGMDDQEYLDRQDEYDMVFFLDERDRWMDSYIYINSWKVVLQSTGL